MAKIIAKTMIIGALLLAGCAEATVPQARNANIPAPVAAEKRREAINEKPDSVMYLPLGDDVLVPERMTGDSLPSEEVGPFELRGETLAGALQLILADYDISIAFESEVGLSKKVTVANLKGPLDHVVKRVCSLADMYCSYEEGALVIKDSQTFTVSLPPLNDAEGNAKYITDIITGLTAVIGASGRAPVSDPTTRTLIYSATQRTAGLAENYFQRLRANTAMIIFETYIWEVSLNAGNSTGIDWSEFEKFGKFNTNISMNGSIGAEFTNPVSIGLPTTGPIGANPAKLLEFLSQFGAVKTISQPQITVLSGASAQLRVADTENYVSEVTSTISGDNTTTSVSTDSVDSGFTLDIGSSWDKSTVYANVNINLTNVDDIEDFTFSDSGANGTDTIIQLPQTTERELNTQIRVRPGDSVLIAGLVRERDHFDTKGPGFMQPVIPTSRTTQTDNLELVIMLRPRVIIYTAPQNIPAQKPVQSLTDLSSPANSYTVPETINTLSPSYIPAAPLPPVLAPVSAPPIVQSTVTTAPVYEQKPAYEQNIEIIPSNESVAPVYSPSSQNNADYQSGYISDRNKAEVSTKEPITVYQPPSYPSPVVPEQQPVITPAAPVYSKVYKPGPISADIYNNAQKLNVYDLYEQGQ